MTDLFVCVVTDAAGREDVPFVARVADGRETWFPLVVFAEADLPRLRALAAGDPALAGQQVTIVQFSTRQVLETIDRR